MRCTNFFYQTKVVTSQNLQLLCYVTFFDILHHYGVVAASQICSVSRKYCAVVRNRFFSSSSFMNGDQGCQVGIFNANFLKFDIF